MDKTLKIVPRLRFDSFNEQLIERRLQEVCSIGTGNKDTKDRIEDGQYPFFVRSNKVERIDTFSYDGEAILTSGDGVGVGRNFHYIVGKFDYHQRVYALKSFKKGYSGKFVFYFFSSKFLKRVLRLSAKNSVDSVRMDMIAEMKGYFPSLEEQQKIADFLTSVDDYIQNLKSQKKALEEYKKGMMQKIFSQEIRFNDENGKDFPSWDCIAAHKLFKNVTNKNHDGDLELLAVTQDNGVVYRKDLDLKINSSKSGILNYKIIEPGDFIISLRSFQGGIEYSTLKGISSPAYTVMKPKIQIIDSFYSALFKRVSFINQLNTLIYGIRDGKKISFNDFKDLKLPYPSLKEQQKIADFLSSIDNLVQSKQSQIEKAEEWKKGLMQQMFV